ncbi:MAG TPA: hypothetical protein DD670_00080, partial [Planctomycetaceae bacterium]|nr:hypothetical protein [Planctomycetaceae bacterium]
MHIGLLYSNPLLGGSETFGLAVAPVWKRENDVTVVNLWSGGGALREACRRAEVPFVGIDGGTRLFRPSLVRNLRSLFAREKFDVVAVFGLRAQILARLLRPWLDSKTVWITMLRGEDAWRREWHVLGDRW